MLKKESLEQSPNGRLKEPTVSCVMIVKNEEACLERCLNSVRPVVDEIVVVDTGSTDQTVAIAERFGARIFHHPWQNDFSLHRNQSLAYAKGDWLFQIDADEELFAEDIPKLREIVKSAQADYYHCRFHDIRQDGSVHGVFHLIRLFRNGMGMTFTQKVHNQLQTRGTGAFSDIRIRHYGYDLPPEKMEAKHIRTTTLLKEMLAADPEDAYSLHQLAASYSMHRDFAEAVLYGEAALAIRRRKGMTNPFFVTTYYTVAQGYFALGNMEDAARIGLSALEFFPRHLDICHLLAAVYFKLQRLDDCRTFSERYFHIFEEFERDPSLIGNFYCQSLTKRHEITFGLACIHFLEKDVRAADAFFIKSFEESGRQFKIGENIHRFYRKEGIEEKAMQWLARICDTARQARTVPDMFKSDASLYVKIGEWHLAQGHLDDAAACLAQADESNLSPGSQNAKWLNQLIVSWQKAAPEEMLAPLGALMTRLGLDTNRCLDSLNDLGKIVYELSEAFCKERQWPLAEQSLRLAVEIAPSFLDRRRFEELLADKPTAP